MCIYRMSRVVITILLAGLAAGCAGSAAPLPTPTDVAAQAKPRALTQYALPKAMLVAHLRGAA